MKIIYLFASVSLVGIIAYCINNHYPVFAVLSGVALIAIGTVLFISLRDTPQGDIPLNTRVISKAKLCLDNLILVADGKQLSNLHQGELDDVLTWLSEEEFELCAEGVNPESEPCYSLIAGVSALKTFQSNYDLASLVKARDCILNVENFLKS